MNAPVDERAQLLAQLNELLSVRFGGVAEVETRSLDAQRRVKYQAGPALDAAIAALQARLNKLDDKPKSATLYAATGKGTR